MGLDMYLNARKFCDFDFRAKPESRPTCVQNNPITQDLVDAGILTGPEYNDRHIRYVEIEIGYWRKANQVHTWFVNTCADGVDQCQRIEVSRNQIADLRMICAAIKADPSKAKQLLPTQSGFFFGGTDYDDGYMYDIDRTLAIIADVEKMPKEWELIYQASW